MKDMKNTTLAQKAVVFSLCSACVCGLSLQFTSNPTQAFATSTTKAQLQDKASQARAVRAQLEDLGAQADETHNIIYSLEEELKETEKKISEAEAEKTETQDKLSKNQDILAKRISSHYKAGNSSLLRVLVGADDFEDLVSRIHYIQTISEKEASVIQETKDLKSHLEEVESSLKLRKADEKRLIQENKTRAEEFESYMNKAEKILASLDDEIKGLMEQQRAEEEAAERAAYERRMAEQATKAAEATASVQQTSQSSETSVQQTQTQDQAQVTEIKPTDSPQLKAAKQKAQADQLKLLEAQKKAEKAQQEAQADPSNTLKQKAAQSAQKAQQSAAKTAGRSNASVVEIARSEFSGYNYRSPYPGVPGGLDCSGLVSAVYQKKGVNLPRSSAAQWEAAQREGWNVSPDNMSPGDLVFYRRKGSSRVGHVSIYTGGGRAFHAYHPGRVSGEGNLDMSGWEIVGAGRPPM